MITLTAAQARLLALLRQGWTLNCYQALYLKRSPAWYVSRGENRESCFASPAQALYARLLMDREPELDGYFETRSRRSAVTNRAVLAGLEKVAA